ncbi:MAG: methyltransferase domain-containing protein [Gaiellaceae bacterium]
MAGAGFDAATYKETTRAQWQDAADAWHRWDPVFDRWLGEGTSLLLDRAAVTEGSRVLDVAAGSGGQTIEAARRVGASGAVLATDIASNILDHAGAVAHAAGLANVATRVMDGENLEVDPESFDAVISRLGLMYLPDKARALASARAALRPGGRYAALVFAEPERNRFFSMPISIIRTRAQLPPPAPGLPGPFSAVGLGDMLGEAGFTDVAVTRLEAPLRLANAAECAQLERESFGALHQMLAGLDAAAQEETWAEIEQALGEFEGPDGFVGPCELLVGAGTR